RSRIVSIFSEALAKAKIPVLDVATRYSDLGEALVQVINPAVVDKYGLEITSFILENVSVPAEVEQAIDKRSSMTAIGNLNDYVKYQMGQAMANGGDSAATLPASMAMGFGMAQEMMKQMQQPAPAASGFLPGAAAPTPTTAPAAAPVLQVYTPEQAAQLLGVEVADVLAELEAGNLKGRKIGSAWRIAQAALDEFLAG
ncbi:MAG TPA: SPFH domain-containing protein, partial [Comamonas denitrificans]|nr:SPFH domain-containing protein [Comamonas denitrificans]